MDPPDQFVGILAVFFAVAQKDLPAERIADLLDGLIRNENAAQIPEQLLPVGDLCAACFLVPQKLDLPVSRPDLFHLLCKGFFQPRLHGDGKDWNVVLDGKAVFVRTSRVFFPEKIRGHHDHEQLHPPEIPVQIGGIDGFQRPDVLVPEHRTVEQREDLLHELLPLCGVGRMAGQKHLLQILGRKIAVDLPQKLDLFFHCKTSSWPGHRRCPGAFSAEASHRRNGHSSSGSH